MMSHIDRKHRQTQASVQIYVVAILCLLAGFAVGYLYRGSAPKSVSSVSSPASQQSAMPNGMGSHGAAPQHPAPDQVKAMADQQAAPLIEQLKSHPNNADLAARIGDLYYDARLFPIAVEYFQKALAINGKSSGARTDLATALFNSNQTDRALIEINRVLQDDPNNDAALFNRGIMKWQGKGDAKSAIADWESILRRNPNYEQAEKVRSFIARATKNSDRSM